MLDSSGVAAWFDRHPEVLAVLVVLAGVLVALVLRRAIAFLAGRVNRLVARGGDGARVALSPGFIRWLQVLTFWGVLLVALIRGLALLGGGDAGLLDGAGALAARLLVALGIVAGGHVAGVLARDLARGLVRSAELAMVPRLIYIVVVAVSVLMALAHLGLDVSLISQVSLMLIGLFFAALGLAFALGARSLVANLAAQSEIGRYRAGDRLRVDGIEGTVLDIDRTGVVLTTDEGLARVPASRFAETSVVLVKEVGEDG